MERKSKVKRELAKFLLKKVIRIPKGTKLYHGTMYSLPTKYPTNKANWFATDPEQSGLHVVKKMGFFQSDIFGLATNDVDILFENTTIETVDRIYPRMYVYETKKDVYLFNLGGSDEMEEFALKIGIKIFNKDDDFTEHNKAIATHLCDLVDTNKSVVGWYRMSDQKEVVICHDTQLFLQHTDTVYMDTSILNFDWRIVQKYMKEFKKFEIISNNSVDKIKTLLIESMAEFAKFVGKNIDDLFDSSIHDSGFLNYTNNDLKKLWTRIDNSFSQKSRRHATIDINYLIMDLENYFGNELFDYLESRYQNSLEKLSNINTTIRFIKSNKLEAEKRYATRNNEDEPISKAVPYIIKHIQPITNKIYFCLLVKNNGSYICKNRKTLLKSDVILRSYWTSDDKNLLRNVAKAFKY